MYECCSTACAIFVPIALESKEVFDSLVLNREMNVADVVDDYGPMLTVCHTPTHRH